MPTCLLWVVGSAIPFDRGIFGQAPAYLKPAETPPSIERF
jgi:hypothetical protein